MAQQKKSNIENIMTFTFTDTTAVLNSHRHISLSVNVSLNFATKIHGPNIYIK